VPHYKKLRQTALSDSARGLSGSHLAIREVVHASLQPLDCLLGCGTARAGTVPPRARVRAVWGEAGRGPQWRIHRISAPANDAVRLPGARRLERQMTVPDGRAGHFRTVSAVVCVYPGPSNIPMAGRQTVGHRPGDRGRAHGGQSTARSYSPGRLPLAARKALHRRRCASAILARPAVVFGPVDSPIPRAAGPLDA